jgi:hypothetical protein
MTHSKEESNSALPVCKIVLRNCTLYTTVASVAAMQNRIMVDLVLVNTYFIKIFQPAQILSYFIIIA